MFHKTLVLQDLSLSKYYYQAPSSDQVNLKMGQNHLQIYRWVAHHLYAKVVVAYHASKTNVILDWYLISIKQIVFQVLFNENLCLFYGINFYFRNLYRSTICNVWKIIIKKQINKEKNIKTQTNNLFSPIVCIELFQYNLPATFTFGLFPPQLIGQN